MNMQRIQSGSIMKNIADLQVGSVIDSIIDKATHLYSDERIQWNGSTLAYTQPIDINFTLAAGGDYAINRLAVADSPITIANNSALVVRLNRTAGTTVLAAGTYPGLAVGEYAVVATASLNAIDLTRKDHVILFRRKDLANGDNFLFSPISKQLYAPGANEFLNTSKVGESFATTATASGTTTLLNTSAQVQQFTGALTQNCRLPDATTMSNGMYFYVANRSSQSVTVQYNDASTAIVLAANTQSLLILISNGSTNGTWDIESTSSVPIDPEEALNSGLATSVAASALTIDLKQSDGSTNPSTSSPVKIAFRSATITSGQVLERSVTAALSVVVPSGATLGHASAVDSYIYVYALDNAGTVELAVSTSNAWDERDLNSTTALSSSSDDANTLYSTTARSNVAIRLIGRLISNQTTAGTWATNMSAIYVGNFGPSGSGGSVLNYLINSNFKYWERQLSGTYGSVTTATSGTISVDRWMVLYDGTIGTFVQTRESFTLGQTDVPDEPNHYFRWNQTAAGSGSTFRRLVQRIDFSGVRTLADETVTVAVWMKADAARSVDVDFRQVFGTGGSPSADVTVAAQTASLTTSWQRFIFTFTIPSISGKTVGTNVDTDYLELRLNLPINTTMTIDIAQAIANKGSVQDWELHGRDQNGELSACRAYFEKTWPVEEALNTNSGGGFHMQSNFSVTNQFLTTWDYNVTKRRKPTALSYSTSGSTTANQYRDNFGGGADRAATTTGSSHSSAQFETTAAPSGTGSSIGYEGYSDAEIY